LLSGKKYFYQSPPPRADDQLVACDSLATVGTGASGEAIGSRFDGVATVVGAGRGRSTSPADAQGVDGDVSKR
jgi:hypothetical protein